MCSEEENRVITIFLIYLDSLKDNKLLSIFELNVN